MRRRSRKRSNCASITEPVDAHRDRALELLQAALKQDGKNAAAARLLAQYEYENHNYAAALGIYEQLKAQNAVPQELAITAANALIIDSSRQANAMARFADAQHVLEAYLADHPKDARIMVSIGQVMLEQNQIGEAAKMAGRRYAGSSRRSGCADSFGKLPFAGKENRRGAQSPDAVDEFALECSPSVVSAGLGGQRFGELSRRGGCVSQGDLAESDVSAGAHGRC